MPPIQQNLFNRSCHQSCKRLPLRAVRFGHVFLSYCLLIFLNMHTCCGKGGESSYVETKSGQRLDGDVSKHVHARSRLECISQCVLQDESCRSVNFKKNSVSKEIKNCELLSTVDSEEPAEHLRKDKDVDYYKLLDKKPPPQKTRKLSTTKSTRRKIASTTKPTIQQPLSSCKELLDKNMTLSNGAYKLQIKDSLEKYSVYCHMTEVPGCGPGGWTLVIKIDGNRNEFNYISPYWTNKKTHAVADGLEGLTEKQTKLASYSNTAFNKICLGMKVYNNTKWIAIDHQASSLFDVIAGESYTTISVGKDTWKSLIIGSVLQDKCYKEGFNTKGESANIGLYAFVRIGLIANNEEDCYSCDSYIGYGASFSGCGVVSKITCGNLGICSGSPGSSYNTDTYIPAFGYILVQ